MQENLFSIPEVLPTPFGQTQPSPALGMQRRSCPPTRRHRVSDLAKSTTIAPWSISHNK
jgi:hypothetical protein